MPILVKIRKCFLDLGSRILTEALLLIRGQPQEARPTGYYCVSLLVHFFEGGLHLGLGLSGIAVRFRYRLILLSCGSVLIVVDPAAVKVERRICRFQLCRLRIRRECLVGVIVVVGDHGQRSVQICERYVLVELGIGASRRFAGFEEATGAVGEFGGIGGMRVVSWIGGQFVCPYLD